MTAKGISLFVILALVCGPAALVTPLSWPAAIAFYICWRALTHESDRS
jgi:hypothetical protein